jgi:4'-phosphopantetheinyl transferase
MKHSFAPLLIPAVSQMRDAIMWAEPPAPGITVAAFTDRTSLNENDLVIALAMQEQEKAQRITDQMERRHYVVRRCFQRVFLQKMLNWQGALSDLVIEHHVDTQPKCGDAPDLRISFSSSGQTALACAAVHHQIGIDIEKLRSIDNVDALAERFFDGKEALYIASLPPHEQVLAFLQHWSAKEAGLKAIGKGIVSGLNSFTLERNNQSYSIDIVDKFSTSAPWNLQFMDFLPDHIVAVVHNSGG